MRPYATRTGPTTAAVLTAVDGLGESDARTIRQLVDDIYGQFTISRQRTLTRVVYDLRNAGLIHTAYRMTISQPDGPSGPDEDRVAKPFPAMFIWPAEFTPVEVVDEPLVEGSDQPLPDEAVSAESSEDGPGWLIDEDQRDLESWTMRRHRHDPNPRWCTRAEAGQILGVSAEHVQNLIFTYTVFSPWIAAGGRVLLRRSDVLTVARLPREVRARNRWAAAKAEVAAVAMTPQVGHQLDAIAV